jgi:transposase-like protein
MFTPPFCPNPECSQHTSSSPRFFRRHGSYTAKCRSHRVPRFRCKSCHRTFSRQTFRSDYYDHKPYLNARLFDLVTMGVGIRMCSRRLGLSLRCTELKLRKMAEHLRELNMNLRRPLQGHVEFQFDELETYETNRSLCPVTVPLLLEKSTRFLIWAESATIRPKGTMTPKRLRRLAIWEKKHGRRVDRSKGAIHRTLKVGAQLLAPGATLKLYTDEKLVYPTLAIGAFGSKLVEHDKTNSKLFRNTANPLFPINHEDARVRNMMGRLHRQSWLVSKMRKYLDPALQLHIAFRNLVRRRFNWDEESPAQLLGFLPRRLKLGEVLSWRQSWGKRSPHPLSRSGRSVGCYEFAMTRGA